MPEKDTKIHVPEIDEPSWVPLIICTILQLYPISAILLARNLYKMWKNGKLKVFRRYALIIGDRAYVRLWELARATGKTKQEVRADLQEMIDKGYLGRRAYVDQSTDCVVIDPERRPDGSTEQAKTAAAPVQPTQVQRPVASAVERPAEPVRPVERPAQPAAASANTDVVRMPLLIVFPFSIS